MEAKDGDVDALLAFNSELLVQLAEKDAEIAALRRQLVEARGRCGELLMAVASAPLGPK